MPKQQRRRQSTPEISLDQVPRGAPGTAVWAEDILREINRGGWSAGYCGQLPERLQAHMRNRSQFDVVTRRAPNDDPEASGEVYRLPWPCW